MQTTDIVIDFTTGLSGSVAWPWPIAVYLFLAGISGGAVALAIIINLYKRTHADNPQMKAATMVGLVTILLGMVCLVLDLTDPFNFWRILIFYNPTSVMSIGVAALLFYIPLLFVLTLLVFRDLPILKFLKPLTDFLAHFRVVLDWVVMILAVVICAYTGFLISALFVSRSSTRQFSRPCSSLRAFLRAAPPFVSLRIASVQSVKTPPCISFM